MNAPTPTQDHDLPLRWQELRRESPELSPEDFRARHADLAREVLEELLLRWQESRRDGHEEAPERLCAACPELAEELRRRVQAVQALEGRFGLTPTVNATDGSATQPAAASPAAARGPVSVPGYEILGELGHGGMGVVYKARQFRPARVVALKMLLSGRHARATDRARFEAEAEALAELQHPNIVPVYQVGEADGLPYFAMEHVEGGSLAHKLRGKPLPPREAAATVETLARAVHAAHQAGILHRDLKPGNVLLTGDGTAKVTDFGLAKRLNRGSDLTPSQAVMGTIAYMAPEQAEGKVKAVGTPADVYGLGAILYECLTGRPPIEADSDLKALSQLLHEDPPAPCKLNPAVPRDLEAVCLKCLQKDPQRRYASALELAEDLHRFLGGEATHARPAGALGRTVKWVRRRPALAALALTSFVAVCAVVGVIVSLFYSQELADRNADLSRARQRAEAARNQEKQAKARAEEERKRAEVAEGLASHRLYAARMLQAQQAWFDGNLPLTEQLIKDQVPPAGGRDFRGFEWDYLSALTARVGQKLATHPGGAYAVTFSPDGKRLASAGADGVVLLWKEGLAAEPRKLPGEKQAGEALSVGFSPSGKRLAVGHADGSVVVWDADSGARRETLPRDQFGRVRALAYSPTGDYLVAVDDRDYLCIWDLAGGKAGRPRVHPNVPSYAVAFLPRSNRFLLAGGSGLVRGLKKVPMSGDFSLFDKGRGKGVVAPWDAGGGRPPKLRRIGAEQLIHGIAVSPDGRWAATAGFDHSVKIWDLTSEREPLTLRGHSTEVLAVAFSPDGRRVASTGWDRTVRLWERESGRELRVFRGHTDVVAAVAFSADGRELLSASADGTVRRWDAESNQEAAVLWRGGATALARSPDGNLLAWVGNGQLRFWDVQRRKPDSRGVGPAVALAFSPRGDRLAVGLETGAVSLWEADPARGMIGKLPLRAWYGSGRPVVSLAFSPDGKALALALGPRQEEPGVGKKPVLGGPQGSQEPGELIVREVSTDVVRWRAPAAHTAGIQAVAFSPDGTRLATAGAGWEGDTRGLRGEIKLWDAAAGKELRTLKGHTGPVLSVTFSPDGKLLASGGYDYTVRLWSGADGAALNTLPGHACMVHSVAFSPDGTRLASGSEDWSVRVWDVQLGAPTLDLRGHTDRVRAVAFSHDGQRLFSASGDGTVRAWEAPRRR
jgi:eukaryotic-like serine/threonine-protein kinase